MNAAIYNWLLLFTAFKTDISFHGRRIPRCWLIAGVEPPGRLAARRPAPGGRVLAAAERCGCSAAIGHQVAVAALAGVRVLCGPLWEGRWEEGKRRAV